MKIYIVLKTLEIVTHVKSKGRKIYIVLKSARDRDSCVRKSALHKSTWRQTCVLENLHLNKVLRKKTCVCLFKENNPHFTTG